ncbi:hypothetical protein EEB19_22495 [Gordonia sp. OPL2]|nr:hypothetical protein EEB19_22495 [Gordonia sp. OPL2]
MSLVVCRDRIGFVTKAHYPKPNKPQFRAFQRRVVDENSVSVYDGPATTYATQPNPINLSAFDGAFQYWSYSCEDSFNIGRMRRVPVVDHAFPLNLPDRVGQPSNQPHLCNVD